MSYHNKWFSIFIYSMKFSPCACYHVPWWKSRSLRYRSRRNTFLENNLGLLDQWAETLLLKFNVVKYHVIYFSQMNPCCSYFVLSYLLSSVNTKQDLRITIDNELKFSTHAKKSAAGVRDLGILNLKLECF